MQRNISSILKITLIPTKNKNKRAIHNVSNIKTPKFTVVVYIHKTLYLDKLIFWNKEESESDELESQSFLYEKGLKGL